MYEIQMALRYAPEYWCDIPDYEGLYQVSNLANVRNIKTGKTLKPWNAGNNVLKVNLLINRKRTTFTIYRLVTLTFLGRSGLTVDHINGWRLDNNIVNLRYLSIGDNARLGNAILNEEQVRQIQQLLTTTTLSQKAIGKQFGVSREAIRDIKFGKRWKHIK